MRILVLPAFSLLLLLPACSAPDMTMLTYRLTGPGEPTLVGEVLLSRLTGAGVVGSDYFIDDEAQVVIYVPGEPGEPEFEQLKVLLLTPGVVEFRVVAVPQGWMPGREGLEISEAQKRGDQGPLYGGPPEGYRWVEGADTGDPETSRDRLVEIPKRPEDRFDGTDVDPEEVAVTADQFGQRVVGFALRKARVEEFRAFTASIVDRPLAIIIDGRVESAPIVREPLPGRAMISSGRDGFAEQEAENLATILRTAPLPCPIELVSEEAVPKAR